MLTSHVAKEPSLLFDSRLSAKTTASLDMWCGTQPMTLIALIQFRRPHKAHEDMEQGVCGANLQRLWFSEGADAHRLSFRSLVLYCDQDRNDKYTIYNKNHSSGAQLTLSMNYELPPMLLHLVSTIINSTAAWHSIHELLIICCYGSSFGTSDNMEKTWLSSDIRNASPRTGATEMYFHWMVAPVWSHQHPLAFHRICWPSQILNIRSVSILHAVTLQFQPLGGSRDSLVDVDLGPVTCSDTGRNICTEKHFPLSYVLPSTFIWVLMWEKCRKYQCAVLKTAISLIFCAMRTAVSA